MRARLRSILNMLADAFWLIPGSLVVGGIFGGILLIRLDRANFAPDWLLQSPWLYSGGGTGARTLLGAIASSTIGVAGTVFSITIAALSLAAGQMGPRLLRNFTHDRGNQVTLGIFLGTFSFALVVLRSVRTHGEGEFVPYISLNVAILLAFVCVGTLVFFVGHMAGRINVDTVVDLVSSDVSAAIGRLTTREAQLAPPADTSWADGIAVVQPDRGYVQDLDSETLADWAADTGTSVRLLVRPGDYAFPGAPVALVRKTDAVADATDAVGRSLTLGVQRAGAADLEYAVRQLVEVAVRALSPGINDPQTAISVVERLGASLCDLVGLQLPTGVYARDDRIVLTVPAVTYSGLTDQMFHAIRQNGAGSVAVLIRMIEVLTAVASCETDRDRVKALQRHADLVLGDATRDIATPADLADIRRRHDVFAATLHRGVAGALAAGGASAVRA